MRTQSIAMALTIAFLSSSGMSAVATGTAEAYLKQAHAFQDTGKQGDARRNFELALREAEAIGQNNPKLPDVLVEVANFYQSVGETDRTESLYLRAINIKNRMLGGYHEDVAKLYHKLGRIYFGDARYAEAAEYFQKALNIYERKLEKDTSIANLNKRKINLLIADVLDDKARAITYTQGTDAASLLTAKAGRIRANPTEDHF